MRDMTSMSMNKVIHGAIRRDLGRFLAALSGFPEGDAVRAGRLWLAWTNLDQQLVVHHEGEHEIAWPALQQVGVTPETLAEMDAEHADMAAALEAARDAMATLRKHPEAGSAAAALGAVQHLEQVTLTHLDHEEQEIEPIYLRHQDSPAIKEMGRRFAKVGPVQGGRFFAWLTDGASTEEERAIRESVPGPALALIKLVFGRGYRRDVAPVWRS